MKTEAVYKDILEKIKEMYLSAVKGDVVYETPETTSNIVSEFNSLVEKLYHRGMCKLKVDIPVTYSDYVMKKGDWIWVEQDEGGVFFYDETKTYCTELDYENALPPEEMFEYE